jgi:hypothetical protein
MPPRLPLRGSALALKEDSSVNPDGSEGSHRLAVPMTGRLAFSPFGFFPFRATTHACLKLWLILPEAGHKDLALFPAMGVSTFFPRRCASPRAPKKDRPSPSSTALRACGCGPDRPRQLIAIEAAMVVAKRKTQGE